MKVDEDLVSIWWECDRGGEDVAVAVAVDVDIDIVVML